MKQIEINGAVKMYSDGVASSYTQLINLIAKADNIEYIKQRIEYLTEFSVVLEFFLLKISSDSFTILQHVSDDELTEILTVKFQQR